MNDLHQLFAEADGVALGDEHDAVEGVGDEEDGQRAVGAELHRADHLALDGMVVSMP